MRCHSGRSYDAWRGDNAFFRMNFNRGHLLLALRWRWHLYFVRPAAKPHYHRLYLGPVEIEWSHL